MANKSNNAYRAPTKGMRPSTHKHVTHSHNSIGYYGYFVHTQHYFLMTWSICASISSVYSETIFRFTATQSEPGVIMPGNLGTASTKSLGNIPSVKAVAL